MSVAKDPVRAAAAEVLLGVSIATLHERSLMAAIGVTREDDLTRALRALPDGRRREVREQAVSFAGEVCRYLGDRHSDDPRARLMLEVWARESRDYAAYDALFSAFEFEGKQRMLDEARRMFPRSMTAHW